MTAIYWFSQLDSTNAECLRKAYNGERAPFVVAAQRQTAGRGTKKRPWHSTEGGLYFSWYLGEGQDRRFVQLVTIAGVLGVADFLEAQGVAAEIKWPNDLFLKGRKICGILGESVTQGAHSHLVLGTGLNLMQKQAQLEQASDQAGSVAEQTGIRLEPGDVLNDVLMQQQKWFALLEQDPEAVKRAYLRRVKTGEKEAESFLGKV